MNLCSFILIRLSVRSRAAGRRVAGLSIIYSQIFSLASPHILFIFITHILIAVFAITRIIIEKLK